MPFVKALFGSIVTKEMTLFEGQISETHEPNLYTEMMRDGKCIVCNTYEEAQTFHYRTRSELFNESFPSLNPDPEKPAPPPPTIDFDKSSPKIINGVPANFIDPMPGTKPAPVVASPAKAEDRLCGR